MFENAKNIRLAVALAAFIVALVVGYVIFLAIDRQGKIAVQVTAVPGDMKLLLNDKEIGPGTIYLKPGYYTINASKPGFETRTGTTEINQDNHTITTALTPESEEAKKWAEKNQDQYLELEATSGAAAAEKGDAFRKKNPITEELPHNSLLYSIGYRLDPADKSGDSIILEIDAPEGYRQAAIYQIYQWGFDPTDFKINFKNYENPFTS